MRMRLLVGSYPSLSKRASRCTAWSRRERWLCSRRPQCQLSRRRKKRRKQRRNTRTRRSPYQRTPPSTPRKRRRTGGTRQGRAAGGDAGGAGGGGGKEGWTRSRKDRRRRRLTSLLQRVTTRCPHWSSRVKPLAHARTNDRSRRISRVSAAGAGAAAVAAGAIVAVARAKASRRKLWASRNSSRPVPRTNRPAKLWRPQQQTLSSNRAP